MPIYEYECAKCGHYLEALQKIADKPLRECPECGKHSLKRLVSAPLFRLAGSGWYETDFKSDKEAKRNLAGREEGPPAESKTAAGSESKPEAKKEPAERARSRAVVSKPAARPPSKPRAKAAAKKAPARKSRKR
jgi:putative FmdB family regulatory protein